MINNHVSTFTVMNGGGGTSQGASGTIMNTVMGDHRKSSMLQQYSNKNGATNNAQKSAVDLGTTSNNVANKQAVTAAAAVTGRYG